MTGTQHAELANGRADAQLVELFLDMLAAERGAAENTLAAYRRDLDDASRFIRSAGQAWRRRVPISSRDI